MPINNAGNSEDVRNSIKSGFARLKIQDFEAAIENEKRNQNRKTVIKHLEAAISRKIKTRYDKMFNKKFKR